jgi:hypothetical protein
VLDSHSIAGTGTVEYYRIGAQTVAPVIYNNLVLSGSGIKKQRALP